MKEKNGYREQLEDIRSVFGDKRLLSKKEVCEYLGVSYKTVIKRVNFKNNMITQTELARQLI